MIVAIPVDEEIKSAYLFEKFGRAPVFAILKTDKGFTKFIPNKSSTSSGGAGVATSQLLIGEGVNTLIANAVGPKALQILKKANIEIYKGIKGKFEDNFLKYLEGNLEKYK